MKPLSLAGAAAMPSAEVARPLGETSSVGLDLAEIARRAADAGDWALVAGVALAPAVVAHAIRLTGRAWVA